MHSMHSALPSVLHINILSLLAFYTPWSSILQTDQLTDWSTDIVMYRTAIAAENHYAYFV